MKKSKYFYASLIKKSNLGRLEVGSSFYIFHRGDTMKQETYCLVSKIPEVGPLFYRLTALQERLSLLKIPQSIPKLNLHLTEVPPFLATEQEIEWFSLGITVGEFFKGRSKITRTTYIDIFENDDEDAVVIRLETDKKFKELVERIRIKIHKLTDLKFPPVNFEANFHATIAHGKDLSKFINDAGGSRLSFLTSVIR